MSSREEKGERKDRRKESRGGECRGEVKGGGMGVAHEHGGYQQHLTAACMFTRYS